MHFVMTLRPPRVRGLMGRYRVKLAKTASYLPFLRPFSSHERKFPFEPGKGQTAFLFPPRPSYFLVPIAENERPRTDQMICTLKSQVSAAFVRQKVPLSPT